MTGTVTNRLDLADPATYDHGIPHGEEYFGEAT